MKYLICTFAALGLFLGASGHARSDFLYWTNDNGGNDGAGDIRRANLDGSGQTILVTGLYSPTGLILDIPSGAMYWADNGTGDSRPTGDIGRANLDGSGQTILVRGLTSPASGFLDVGDGQIYFP